MYRCADTKKLMARRFSSSPELISNFGLVPETGKMVCYRFFDDYTAIDGRALSWVVKYPTGREIWELNSQYFLFLMQTRVSKKNTPKWDVFCANTVLDAKYEILGVQLPYFAGSRVFCYQIGRHTTCWCSNTQKSTLSRFSPLWINAKI